MTGIKNEKTNSFKAFSSLKNNNTANNNNSNSDQNPKDSRVFNYFCGKLPLNATSRMMGRIAGVNLPGWMRTPVHRVYGWMFNVQMNEIEHNNDLRKYSSLSHFFSRSIQETTRPIDKYSPLVSPCDGRVLSCGEIFEGHLEQVKGLNYTLNGLLGPNTWSILPNWLRELVEEPNERPDFISVYKLEEDAESISIKSNETDLRFNERVQPISSSLEEILPDEKNQPLEEIVSYTNSTPSSSSNDAIEMINTKKTKNDDNNNFNPAEEDFDAEYENFSTEMDKVHLRQLTFGDQDESDESDIYTVKDNDQLEFETVEEANDEKIYNQQLLIKNHIYNQSPVGSPGTSLFHCVIYLAPGDYHKFHSPTYWKIFMRRHFPGTLFSVSPKVTNWHSGVFCANERASYMGRWKHGFFAFVAVGALNVGSIKVPLDPELKTNLKANSFFRRILVPFKARWRNTSNSPIPVITQSKNYHDFTFNNPVMLNYGEQFGQFNFGSTIVLIFEAPKDFKFSVKIDEKIKVGQSLGSF